MIEQLQFSLRTAETPRLPSAWAYCIYGWLMSQLPADTAARLAAGQYDPTAVYVTTDGATWENWQAVFAGDDSLNFFVADSCYFMVPAG